MHNGWRALVQVFDADAAPCLETLMEITKEEMSAINTLKRLQKNWPKSLWLFANGQSLCVLKKTSDNKRAYGEREAVDQDYVVASISIENDGGDF
jgi:hypothetical protein